MLVCGGHIYPEWQRGRYVNFFLLICAFIPMEVYKNQEDCPNYLALKDHSKKLKMPGRNILQTVFLEESYCDPGEGETPYIMALYLAESPP